MRIFALFLIPAVLVVILGATIVAPAVESIGAISAAIAGAKR